MVRVFKLHNYDLFNDHNNDYIIYNRNKTFESGHVHLANYHTAKYLINLAYNQSMPKTNTPLYLIDSLIKISTDESYIHKLNMLKCRNTKVRRYNKTRYH